jgi:hypothetical protein
VATIERHNAICWYAFIKTITSSLFPNLFCASRFEHFVGVVFPDIGQLGAGPIHRIFSAQLSGSYAAGQYYVHVRGIGSDLV